MRRGEARRGEVRPRWGLRRSLVVVPAGAAVRLRCGVCAGAAAEAVSDRDCIGQLHWARHHGGSPRPYPARIYAYARRTIDAPLGAHPKRHARGTYDSIRGPEQRASTLSSLSSIFDSFERQGSHVISFTRFF